MSRNRLIKLTEKLMNVQTDQKLPDSPGVYIFRGPAPEREILYIGRATSLRDRVRSYFGDDLIHTRGPLLVDMVTKSNDIEWQETDSVLEAIILEANLIKKHQPHYNTKEKDNKSFSYIIITKEEYPRVLLERGRTIENSEELGYEIGRCFGPYPHTGTVIEALKIIRKMFPYRDSSCHPNSGRPCFYRQIGLCPGVCTGEVSRIEYKKYIKRIEMFLEGRRAALIERLEKEMAEEARKENFEEAAVIRGTLHKLTHIHDMSLIKEDTFDGKRQQDEEIISTPDGEEPRKFFRIEAYDVAHLGGSHIAGVMVVAHDGMLERSQYRKFRIRTVKNAHETQSLKEVLSRRLGHPEWSYPDLLVVDGNEVQRSAAEQAVQEFLATLSNAPVSSIPIVAVVKDDRHKARDILGDPTLIEAHRKTILKLNVEAHRFSLAYHRLLRSKGLRLK